MPLSRRLTTGWTWRSGGSTAQDSIDPATWATLQNAAGTGSNSALALQGAVIQSIVRRPDQVEATIGAAVGLAPQFKSDIVVAAIQTFPGFADRIYAGAGGDVVVRRRPTTVSSSGQTASTASPASTAGRVLRKSWFDPGPYLDAGVGLVLVQEADLSDSTLPGITGELSSNPSFFVDGAVGYRFGNGIRGEVQVAYRRNDLDTISLTAFNLVTITGNVDGRIEAISGIASGFYDFNLGRPVIPYIGAGIGIASLKLKVDSTGFDDSETLFAYQFAGGGRYQVAPEIMLRAGYKYFATTDPKFGTTEGEYKSHAFEIGLSYIF